MTTCFEGGENSVFHIVKLNRGYDDDGMVTLDPELIFTTPGYDDELIADVGPNVSIENSVAISANTVYFANSGGLVQGWDIDSMIDGEKPEQVFRYWVGDDVDASVVVDDQGFLYVGVEYEQGRSRSLEVGQVVKLDPSNPDDPLVWSVFDTRERPDGVWATPAIHRDLVIVPTDSGRVLGIDRDNGEVRWEFWPARTAVEFAGDRRRRTDPDRLRGLGARVRCERHDSGPRPNCGPCTSSSAWSRRRRCGMGASLLAGRAGQVHMIADGS